VLTLACPLCTDSKAWETYPKDVVYLNNLAAAYFEQGSYDKCIETAQNAVDEARNLRADCMLADASLLARLPDLPPQTRSWQSAPFRSFRLSRLTLEPGLWLASALPM
jgi:tetratricopeptide (TPR) repeat protein